MALNASGILSAGAGLRDGHGGAVKAIAPLVTGRGLLARFTPVKNVTPPGVLKQKIYLPCVLGTFTVTETALHNDYNTLSSGQFSQPGAGGQGAVQLRTFDIDTLTLTWDAAWLVVTNQEESLVRSQFTKILRSRKPVQLMINFHPHPQKDPVLNIGVTLRQKSEDIRPGENDTRYMTFQIEEWRDPSTKRRGSAGTNGRKRGVSLPATVKLAADDTLDSLSQAYYGTYAGWRDIRDANGITTKFGAKSKITALGGRWKVGVNVKIPAVPMSAKPQAYLGN